VTICIVAKSKEDFFVAIADRLLSLATPDEFLPGVENATAKGFDIGWGWYALALPSHAGVGNRDFEHTFQA
jgi:hypothetical protein